MNRIPPSPIWTPGVLGEILQRSLPENPPGILELELARKRLSPAPPVPAPPPPSHPLDDLVFLPGGLTRLVTEPERERCCTETDIPGRLGGRPLELDIPLIVGGFPPRSLTSIEQEAISIACSRAGTASFVEGHGPFPQRSLTVLRLPAGQPLPEGWDQSRVAALDLVFGEDPGILDRSRLSDAIASARESAQNTLPIGITLGTKWVRSNVTGAAEAGADFLILELLPWTAESISSKSAENPFPRLDALVMALAALREMDSEETVPLVVSGGLRHGADVARVLALGARAALVAQPALLALATGDTLVPEPAGTGQDRATPPREAEQDARVCRLAEALARYLDATAQEIRLIACACGKTNIHNLEIEDLRALNLETARMVQVPLAGVV